MRKRAKIIQTLLVRFFVGTDRKSTFQSDVRQGMLMANVEGMFATVFYILVSGAFLTGYALYIGMNDFHLGLLGAIPAFAIIPGLFGAYAAEGMRSRKKVTIPAVTLNRLLWIPLILLLFVKMSVSAKVWIFLMIYLSAAMVGAMCVSPWQSWISDLVPEQIRGRFFGQRNRILNVASICTLLLGGWLLDGFKGAGRELYGYVTILSAAVVFAGFGIYALHKQYEPPMHPLPTPGFWENFLRPLKDKDYKKVVAAFMVLQFSLGLSAAFFSAYMLKYLNMSFSQISFFTIYSLVLAMFFNPFWGQIVDVVGLRPVLLVNLILVAIIPIIWVFTLSTGSGMLWLVWTLVGVGWCGFDLAAFNLPFALSPKQGRTYYLGVLSIANGGAFFLASIIAGAVVQNLQGLNLHLGPFRIVHYHVLFIASGIGRFISALLFLRVKEGKSKGVLYTVQFTSSIVYTKLMTAGKIVLFPGKDRKDHPKIDAVPPHTIP
jgi:MFS family permease